MPFQFSVCSGPIGVRPRDGFMPNRPVQAAGMRIDPPPSLAWASGTTPAATAADAPPDDPPDVRVTSHGLRVWPYSVDSVVVVSPNSGLVVCPNMTRPALR